MRPHLCPAISSAKEPSSCVEQLLECAVVTIFNPCMESSGLPPQLCEKHVECMQSANTFLTAL